MIEVVLEVVVTMTGTWVLEVSGAGSLDEELVTGAAELDGEVTWALDEVGEVVAS